VHIFVVVKQDNERNRRIRIRQNFLIFAYASLRRFSPHITCVCICICASSCVCIADFFLFWFYYLLKNDDVSSF